MSTVIHRRTEVQEGGQVTVQSNDLPEGAVVDVTVTVPESSGLRAAGGLTRLINAGTHAFKTAEDVDASIRELRD